MLPIILTSVAWYTIPKGIEYLTTDCEMEPQSKIEHIQTKLFGCKCMLGNLARANTLSKFVYKFLQIPYTRMWIAVLIAPGLKKILPFKSPTDRLLQMAICYSLFSSNYFLKRFIKSSQGIKCMTSPWGLKVLHTDVGLYFMEKILSENRWRSNSFRQMMIVLELQLQPSDTYDFLKAKNKENLLSVVERIKHYKSDSEFEQLLNIINNRYPERFGAIDEDQLECLPQQTRELLLIISNFESSLSIFDKVFSESPSFGGPCSIREYLSAVPRYLFPYLYQSEFEPLLPKLPDYPEDIHDTDPILNKIQCPLLCRSIRSAVVDPTNQQTIYDRRALKAYLQHDKSSPITRKKICTTFDPESKRGSKYDTILRYRKACLRLEKLKEPEEFIANLKQVFLEVSKLESPSDVKQASEGVRDFFQEGFLSAYDTRNLEYDDWTRDLARRTGAPEQARYIYWECKLKHNHMLSSRDLYTNFGVRKWIRLPDEILEPEDYDQFGNRKPGNRFEPTIENFDQYRFIEEEVRREIQKIKESQEELIQFFS